MRLLSSARTSNCLFLATLIFCLCCSSAYGAPTVRNVLRTAEIMPAFSGNVFDHMADHLRYPEAAAANDQSGRTIVSFIVEESGRLDSIYISRSSGFSLLDSEAVRVIREMPDWMPGFQNGAAVPVYFTLPVSFTRELCAQVKAHQPTSPRFVRDDSIYSEVDSIPVLAINFGEFIKFNLRYPPDALQYNSQGRTVHRIVVDEQGYFRDLELITSSGFRNLDTEAARVLHGLIGLNLRGSPPCKPAQKDRRYVKSYLVLPISFAIDHGTAPGIGKRHRYYPW